jgi:hypothetical protein
MSENFSDECIDLIYQRIGEFVVSFQWLENRFREIGWLLIDPNRTKWPLEDLRDITNYDLLNQVNSLYSKVVGAFSGKGVAEYCDSFEFVINEAHKLRQIRNSLLHSAFVELKAGGKVKGIMQVNPRLEVDENGDYKVVSEILSDKNLSMRITELAPLSIAVNFHYSQLIAWAPFDKTWEIEECGIPFHTDGLPFSNDTNI